MKTIIGVLSFLFIIQSTSFSQMALEWMRYFGPSAPETFYSDNYIVKADDAGNAYIIGTMSMANGYLGDATYLLAYNRNGVQQYYQLIGNMQTGGAAFGMGCFDSHYNSLVIINPYNTQSFCKYFRTTGTFWQLPNPNSFNCKALGSDQFDNIYYMGASIDNSTKIEKYDSLVYFVSRTQLPDSIHQFTTQFALSGANYLIAGKWSGGASDSALIYKISPSGNLMWRQTYLPSGVTMGQYNHVDKILIGPSGNIYMVADMIYPANNTDYVIAKFTQNGERIWANHFDATTSDQPNDLTLDNSENLYVSGTSIVKYDSSGNFLWSQPGSNAHAFDKNFNVYLALGYNSYFIRTQMITNTGSVAWTFDYSLPNSYGHTANSISVDSSLDVFVDGEVATDNGYGGITLKYMPAFSVSGTVMYRDNNQPVTRGKVKAFHFTPSNGIMDFVDSAVIQSNGTYTLIHVPHDTTYVMAFENDDFAATYYDTSIDWKNARIICPQGPLSNIDIKVGRVQTSPGPYHVRGQVTGSGSPFTDAVVYLTSATNNPGSVYKGSSFYYPNNNFEIDSLAPGSYQLTAYRPGYNSASLNITITNMHIENANINLTVFTSAGGIGYNVPKSYSLRQNYPNPFNPSTKLEFDLPKKSNVKLVIYDLLGREVAVLANGDLNEGTYSYEWDGSGYSSGIYFYKLQAGDFVQTKKMVLVK
jgi:hypothetical protein